MTMSNRLLATALAGLTVIAAHVAAQGTPPQQPPPAAPTQPPPATPPQTPEGGGRGRGRGQGQIATFPAQQRPPGDPELIAKGKQLFTATCVACHGADLRGGVTGGPNLLRSAVVLMDQKGELILPIVHGARAERGMPPQPQLTDDDVKAIAEYIHSVVATARGQGAPPESEAPPPNALVGDAKAGEAYFNAKCASCHSPTGDLAGIGSRIDEAKNLQNYWVVGGGGGGNGRGGRGGRGAQGAQGASSDRRTVTAVVTMPNGEKVQGQVARLDNFFITLLLDDGRLRTIRRDGTVPKIDVKDPLEFHKNLPAILTDKDMHDVTAYLATLK
jgi:cytochrome c oxidase cbb3-type subunit III